MTPEQLASTVIKIMSASKARPIVQGTIRSLEPLPNKRTDIAARSMEDTSSDASSEIRAPVAMKSSNMAASRSLEALRGQALHETLELLQGKRMGKWLVELGARKRRNHL